ncbi:MAG: DUF1326 domain-containing protein [Rhodanobacteraceae bacterium]|nr:MAG: DUF1326 domain-containing protein [Rhodanobacteraceae bacterium]
MENVKWKLKGSYFETCNCDAACPCVFTSPPTQGECTVLIAWHIERGKYGDVNLDGLNAALAVHAPGTMVETKWTAAAYFDERADAAQTEALHKIFSGQAGGHPAVLASFVGKMLGAKSVPMHFKSEGKQSSLSVPGIIEAEIKLLEGQGGGPITIAGHPLCIAPGEPATVARSQSFRFKDYDWNWKLSGRAGFRSPFAYASD